MQTCSSRTQTTPTRRPQSTPRATPTRPGTDRIRQSPRRGAPERSIPAPAVAMNAVRAGTSGNDIRINIYLTLRLPEKFLGQEVIEENEEYVGLAPDGPSDCLAQVYDAVPIDRTRQSKRCGAARRVGQRPSCTARYVPSVSSRFNSSVPRSHQSCCVDERRLEEIDSVMMKECTGFDRATFEDLDDDDLGSCGRGRSCC
ncbi:unnamed protein product [Phyllotreta striolata]|uniref:Uncharacterized protein n=1 Tax=Phyllotreta striolata TaxID=444603 RepID=A0A9N9XK72_PHYSR|nr:unnamed protein product [Phyllotreta striolata]